MDEIKNVEDECRICYLGESVDLLVVPCGCRGSLGKVHKGCLETWLQMRFDASRCEICRVAFPVDRRLPSWMEWWKSTAGTGYRGKLLEDLVSVLVPLPFALIATWLLSPMYYDIGTMSTVCLVTLLHASVLCLVWIWLYAKLWSLFIVENWHACNVWRRANGKVVLVLPDAPGRQCQRWANLSN